MFSKNKLFFFSRRRGTCQVEGYMYKGKGSRFQNLPRAAKPLGTALMLPGVSVIFI